MKNTPKTHWILCVVLTVLLPTLLGMVVGVFGEGASLKEQLSGEKATHFISATDSFYVDVPENELAKRGRAVILRTHPTAQEILRDMGLSQSEAASYEEGWMQSYDVVAVAFPANPTSTYTAGPLELQGDRLIVPICERVPKIQTQMLSYKVVVLTVEKGQIPQGVQVVLQQTQVVEQTIEETPRPWLSTTNLVLVVTAVVTVVIGVAVVIAKRRLAKRGRQS